MNETNENQAKNDLLERACQARAHGNPWQAIELCRELLSADPRSAEAWDLLGQNLVTTGALAEAGNCLSEAIKCDSGKAEYYLHLGEINTQLGCAQEALRCFQKARQLDDNDVEVLNGYGIALWRMGQLKEARSTLERAINIQPDHAFANRNLRLLSGQMVDRWHFPMVNDEPRNRIFEQALKQAIGEDTVVLDIGTGTGLLSLMAARAGARQVIACEANPFLAEVAREIVEINGYSDRIRILAKFSQQIDPDTDFPNSERPNLVVAEIFDTVVIGEGALNAFDHARRHLLAPDATIMPRRAELCGGLIQSDRLWREGGVGHVSGFDVTPLNRFRPDTVGLEAASFAGKLLSEDFVIFPFDFTGEGTPTPENSHLEIPVTRKGVCHGVVYWIKLYLDDDLILDNRPDFGDGGAGVYCEHWYQLVKLLVPPIEVEPGMVVHINARQNRHCVALVIYDPATGEPLN